MIWIFSSRFKALIFFLITLSSSAFTHVSQDALKQKAENEGFGYKSSNLMLLEALLYDRELQDSISPLKVQVPEFEALTSQQVQEILKLVGLDLPKAWKEVITNTLDPISQVEVFETKQIPSHFLKASQVFADSIKSKFNLLANSSDPQLFFGTRHLAKLQLSLQKGSLWQNPQVFQESTIRFFQKARQNDWRLMVRSTGKEDTEKLANAGGNKSVANVPPTTAEVLKAIGEVVGSYFEDRSLSQRVRAGDMTLFDTPLTPVLIQHMVGEDLNGASKQDDIVTGCVMYTEEANTRIKDIHTLQCSFGHNEGVVQSIVPLDTFYVSAEGSVQNLIKKKSHRMVPMRQYDTYSLQKMKNPLTLQNQPSLPKQAVLALWRIASKIEQAYGKSMDIELAYIPREKTLYIFQARPIVKPESKSETEPNYIPVLESFDRKDIVSLSIVNLNNHQVEELGSQDEVLRARTLEEALIRYQTEKGLSSTVKTVIVAQQADVTSHAAATFRGEGLSIFIAEEYEKLLSLLSRTETRWLLDKQQGRLLAVKASEHVPTVTGWNNYPLPLVSSIGTFADTCLVKTLDISDTCDTDETARKIEEIKHDTENLRQQSHRVCSSEDLDCLSEKAVAGAQIHKFEALHTQVQELQKNRQSTGADAQLKRLFFSRFLESALKQDTHPSFVSTDSFESLKVDREKYFNILKTHILPLISSSKISSEILEKHDLFSITMTAFKFAYSDEVKSNILLLVDKLLQDGNQKKIEEFKLFMEELKQFKILGFWLNHRPEQPYVQHLSIEHLELSKKELAFSRESLKTIAEQRSILENYDANRWSEAGKFEKNQEKFEELQKFYMTHDFLYSQPEQLVSFARSTLMGDFVELFDATIKDLKSSVNYADQDQKLEHFKRRVKSYLEVLEAWSQINNQNINKLTCDIGYEHSKTHYSKIVSPYQYAKHILSLLNDKTNLNSDDFFPSKDFSVVTASLGSPAAMSQHRPKTIEDFFTLAHQSLNTIIAAMMNSGDRLILPSSLNHVKAAIFSMGSSRADLIGYSLEEESIVYKLSLPLESHALRLDLIYKDNSSPSVQGHFMFLWNGYYRGHSLKETVEFFSDVTGVKFTLLNWTAKEFQIVLDNINKLKPQSIRWLVTSLINQSDNEGSNCEPYNLIAEEDMLVPKGYEAFLKYSNQNHKLFFAEFLIKEGLHIPELISFVKEKDFYRCDELPLTLLRALLKKGHLVEQAIKAASSSVLPYHMSCVEWRLDLFKSLLEQGHGIEQAAETVQRWKDKHQNDAYISQAKAIPILFEMIEQARVNRPQQSQR